MSFCLRHAIDQHANGEGVEGLFGKRGRRSKKKSFRDYQDKKHRIRILSSDDDYFRLPLIMSFLRKQESRNS